MAAERADSSERRDRIKDNYAEPGFRQLHAALVELREDKLLLLDTPEHAAAHLARGREAFEQGRDDEAAGELQVVSGAQSYVGAAADAGSSYRVAHREIHLRIQRELEGRDRQ